MLNSINFYGSTKYLSCNSDGKYKTVSVYPYGRSCFGDTRGLGELVKKHSFPWASVEETIGKFHDNYTYKIYITDPKEVVTDLIRQNNDYIVFDNEPEFPNLESDYFDSSGIKTRMQDIKDYFIRLKNSGSEANSEIKEADNQLSFVDRFLQIYEKSQAKINEINLLKKNIRNRTVRLQELQNNIPIYTKELDKKRNRLLYNKKTLSQKENLLRKDITLLQQIKNRKNSEIINDKIRDDNEQIQILTKRIQKIEKRILFLEDYMSTAPDKIINLKREAEVLKSKLEKCEQLVSPEYTKLCKFCIKSGKKIGKYL